MSIFGKTHWADTYQKRTERLQDPLKTPRPAKPGDTHQSHRGRGPLQGFFNKLKALNGLARSALCGLESRRSVICP